ncbi:MAG TPA: hypothetical protein VNG33_11210 [Polyangiaceae bacterium]|nr:hypothetical protein [Polyangiaceae bacterium]
MEQQFVIDPGIEVGGGSIGSIIDAFQQYPSIVTKYLVQSGLLTGKQSQIDRAAWYPLDKWLSVYHSIAKDVGLNSLYTIGKKVPEYVELPPQVTDIRSLFSTLNIAYHLTHRKNGVVMFDPSTGKMLDGIGNVTCDFAGDERKLTLKFENPYPCEFDRGLIHAFAMRFEPAARVVHDSNAPCRKKGASSCTYVVSW